MDAGPLRDVLTLLLGVATGVLSGAFGVGGAVISTPGIRLLGASALAAIGSTLPSILPSAASGTIRYAREGLIDWRAVAWTVPPGAVAAVLGSVLSRVVPGEGHLLQLLTAGLLAFTAVRLSRPRRTPAPAPAAARPALETPVDPAATGHGRPQPARLVAVGAAAGLMSGLLGIGGGVVMVPGFTVVAGLPLKGAIATSLACVGAFALPGTVTHALIGNIDWRFALWLAAGVVPGARLGAIATIRAAEHRLRYAVAAFLGGIAVVYAAGEIIALANR